jgi:hypothetical protein
MNESKNTAARERLNLLVGKWNLDISFADGRPWPPGAWATFEWHPDAPLLIYRGHQELPEAPDSVAIIGCDGMNGTYTMLYTDDRDVQRIYDMSLDDREWTWQRFGKPFSQRYVGTISEDKSSIIGRVDMSHDDGTTWELDLNWNYIKVR